MSRSRNSIALRPPAARAWLDSPARHDRRRDEAVRFGEPQAPSGRLAHGHARPSSGSASGSPSRFSRRSHSASPTTTSSTRRSGSASTTTSSVWNDPVFRKATWNTVVYTFWTVPVSMAIARGHRRRAQPEAARRRTGSAPRSSSRRSRRPSPSRWCGCGSSTPSRACSTRCSPSSASRATPGCDRPDTALGGRQPGGHLAGHRHEDAHLRRRTAERRRGLYEAASIDGAVRDSQVLLDHAADAQAGDLLRVRHLDHRRVPGVRPDLRPDRRWSGERDHDDDLRGLPVRIPELPDGPRLRPVRRSCSPSCWS